MKLSTALQKTGFGLILAIIGLLPLFFLPFTADYYEFSKYALLVFLSFILLLVWTSSFMAEKQVRLTYSPFGLPLIAVAAAWLLSAFLRSPNKFEAFLQPAGPGSILALALIFFAAINLVHTRKELELTVYTFIGSLSLLSIITIFWGSGLAEKIIPLAFMKTPIWTPTGNPLTTLMLHFLATPFLAILIFKEKTGSIKSFMWAVALFLSVISTGLLGYRIFSPQSPFNPSFLPLSTSWSIALETLKSSPIFGTGPATYLSDFTRFRPISFNLSPNWATRFTASNNYYLQLLATLGFLGLACYLFLVSRSLSQLIRILRTTSDSPLHPLATASLASLAVAFIVQFFLPTSLTLLVIIFILLILSVNSLKLLGSSSVHEANIDIVAATDSGRRFPLLPVIFFTISLALVIPAFYLAGRGYYAETLFQKSLIAAGKNNGKRTYDTLTSTIAVNPYIDSYRVVYSQTAFILANGIASKKDLSTDERTTVTQLLQQAIQEGKNAVALNPIKVTNVENLASIYQNLLNLAQGADQWTLASYQQAITLDPVNPNLRISLGGLFYAGKNYDEALRLFQQAVDLKPDLPNAHYNLASTYREKGDFQKALVSMRTVLNLVDRTSPDYTKVQSELEDLQKKVGQTATVSNPPSPKETELTAPQALPTPKISPPIELPAELGPNSTPSPEPTPSTP